MEPPDSPPPLRPVSPAPRMQRAAPREQTKWINESLELGHEDLREYSTKSVVPELMPKRKIARELGKSFALTAAIVGGGITVTSLTLGIGMFLLVGTTFSFIPLGVTLGGGLGVTIAAGVVHTFSSHSTYKKGRKMMADHLKEHPDAIGLRGELKHKLGYFKISPSKWKARHMMKKTQVGEIGLRKELWEKIKMAKLLKKVMDMMSAGTGFWTDSKPFFFAKYVKEGAMGAVVKTGLELVKTVIYCATAPFGKFDEVNEKLPDILKQTIDD